MTMTANDQAVTEKTKMYVTKTKARVAIRRLRTLGVLSYWDGNDKALVALVTKQGVLATRGAMRWALDDGEAE